MKVLFIGHSAQRAGAELQLLNFMLWLRETHPEVEFELLLRKSGPLEKEFRSIGSVVVWPADQKTETGFRWFRKKGPSPQTRLVESLGERGFTRILNSTMTNGPLLQALAPLGIPVVSLVRELGVSARKHGWSSLLQTLVFSDQILADSQDVAEMVREARNLPEDGIEVVPPFWLPSLAEPASLKNLLWLPSDAVLAVACGSGDWKKGRDWFVPVAVQVLRENPGIPLHFVWIGGAQTPEWDYDRIQSGRADRIHYLKALPNVERYFAEFKVFLLFSRAEAFGVVNLEAGLRGVPVVGFREAGGSASLIEQGLGLTVPYGDLGGFADAVNLLLHDADVWERFHRQGPAVAARYDRALIAPRIWNVLKSAGKRPGKPAPGLSLSLGRWEPYIASKQPHLEANAVRAGRKLYVIGGYLAIDKMADRMQVFDIDSETWSYGPPLPDGMPLSHAATASDGESLFVVSGQPGAGCGGGQVQAWVLEPGSDSWSTLPPLPETRFASRMEYLDGRLHLISGVGEDRETIATEHFIHQLGSQGWTLGPPIPRGGDHAASLTRDGCLYVIGGEHGHARRRDSAGLCCGSYIAHSYLYRFDPREETWTRLADLPVPVSHCENQCVVVSDLLVVLGGSADHDVFQSVVQIYDFKTDQWTCSGTLPEPRKGGIAWVEDGFLHVNGGQILVEKTMRVTQSSWRASITIADRPPGGP